MPIRGFILQPTYRVTAGRPVVHLYGRLEDGRTFLVRDARQVPHFYVESRDADRARALGARPLTPGRRVTLAGQPVCPRGGRGAGGRSPAARRPAARRHRLPRGRRAFRHAIPHRPGRSRRRWRSRARATRRTRRSASCSTIRSWRPPTGRRGSRVLSLDIETDPQARSAPLDRAPRRRGVRGAAPDAAGCGARRRRRIRDRGASWRRSPGACASSTPTS